MNSSTPDIWNAGTQSPNYPSAPPSGSGSTGGTGSTGTVSGAWTQVQLNYISYLMGQGKLNPTQAQAIETAGPGNFTASNYPTLSPTDLANLGYGSGGSTGVGIVTYFVPAGLTTAPVAATPGSLWYGADNAMYQALANVPAGSGPPTDGQVINNVVAWKKVAASGSLTAFEAQILPASAIGAPVANTTVAFNQNASGDVQRANFHQLSLSTGAGGSAAGVVVAVTFPVVASRPNQTPKMRLTLNKLILAAGYKPIDIEPTFNANGYCNGYQLRCPVALVSGDGINCTVEVVEVVNP